MADNKKVLLVGWDPDADYQHKWPDINPEKLRAALESDRNKLNGQGYDATWRFLLDPTSAGDSVHRALSETTYDCILIGAGVRLDPESLIVFEDLVNAAHKAAPEAAIFFNTNPSDTAEAVKRWI
jgi:hypothetical protein